MSFLRDPLRCRIWKLLIRTAVSTQKYNFSLCAAHLQRVHRLRSKDEYGPQEWVWRAYHSCRLCGSTLLWTNSLMSSHTNKKHGLRVGTVSRVPVFYFGGGDVSLPKWKEEEEMSYRDLRSTKVICDSHSLLVWFRRFCTYLLIWPTVRYRYGSGF